MAEDTNTLRTITRISFELQSSRSVQDYQRDETNPIDQVMVMLRVSRWFWRAEPPERSAGGFWGGAAAPRFEGFPEALPQNACEDARYADTRPARCLIFQNPAGYYCSINVRLAGFRPALLNDRPDSGRRSWLILRRNIKQLCRTESGRAFSSAGGKSANRTFMKQ